MKKSTMHLIPFGPPIPTVRVRDFSKLPFTKQQMQDMWCIVGPSVEKNLAKGLPLWSVITAAYAEGLCHGSQLIQQSMQPTDPIDPIDPTKQYREVPINVANRSRKTI